MNRLSPGDVTQGVRRHSMHRNPGDAANHDGPSERQSPKRPSSGSLARPAKRPTRKATPALRTDAETDAGAAGTVTRSPTAPPTPVLERVNRRVDVDVQDEAVGNEARDALSPRTLLTAPPPTPLATALAAASSAPLAPPFGGFVYQAPEQSLRLEQTLELVRRSWTRGDSDAHEKDREGREGPETPPSAQRPPGRPSGHGGRSVSALSSMFGAEVPSNSSTGVGSSRSSRSSGGASNRSSSAGSDAGSGSADGDLDDNGRLMLLLGAHARLVPAGGSTSAAWGSRRWSWAAKAPPGGLPGHELAGQRYGSGNDHLHPRCLSRVPLDSD